MTTTATAATIDTAAYTNNGQYPAPTGDGVWTLIDADGTYLPAHHGDYADLVADLAPGAYTLCPSSYAN